MIQLSESLRFVFNKGIVIEDFMDGSLIFHAKYGSIIEVNNAAREVLSLLDGRRDLKRVINKYQKKKRISEVLARKDVQQIIMSLALKKVITPMVKNNCEGKKFVGRTLFYLANPKVSFREEKDGALLYSAEKDGLQIINPIGAIIWQFIRILPRTWNEIAAYLKEVCVDVPVDKVEVDIKKYLTELVREGYINEMVNEKDY